jgi:hypothetical protein
MKCLKESAPQRGISLLIGVQTELDLLSSFDNVPAKRRLNLKAHRSRHW